MKFSKTRPAKVVMLGAGGTGAHIAPHLYRLLYALKRPVRFIICDGDVVEEKNLVRQNFIPADLGENKAKVLAERYSTVFGMETEYVPSFVETEERLKALWEKADRLGTFLEKEKHDAYLVGFADNTVRPNDTISRAEVAQILYRLMTVDAHMAYDTEKNAYTDVTADAWYNIPVSTLTAMGILKGRASDTFDPAAPISRAEFAAIMARFHGGKFEGENPFADTADCWAKEDIGLVSGLGWMAGVGGNNFAPMRSMTRAEVVAVLNRALGRCPETVKDILPGAKTFPDNADETAWFYLDIQEAINGHS